MARHSHSNTAADKAIRAIDRKREQERYKLLQAAYQRADELAGRLVQKLLDNHIIETTSDRAIREVLTDQLQKLSTMEEFDLNFKIAPLRGLVNDPNIVSLYLTQYIIEDLVNHSKIQDVFGDDAEIYRVVDSVFASIRPRD